MARTSRRTREQSYLGANQPGGRGTSAPRSAAGRHHRRHALLHFFRRDVLNVRVNPPANTESVHAGAPVSVELVLRLHLRGPAGVERLPVSRVAVVDV